MAKCRITSNHGTTWAAWTTDGTESTTNAWTTWTCDSGTSTTDSDCISTDNVWTMWVYASSDGKTVNYYDGAGRRITAEQREQQRIAAERRQAEYRAQEEKRKAEQVKAEATAKELLEMFLTPDQKKSLDEISAIVVKSERERLYRIKKGWAGNVEELDGDGKVIARYCIHPVNDIPHHDNMLSQKLMLETNEAEFLRTANRTPIQ